MSGYLTDSRSPSFYQFHGDLLTEAESSPMITGTGVPGPVVPWIWRPRSSRVLCEPILKDVALKIPVFPK